MCFEIKLKGFLTTHFTMASRRLRNAPAEAHGGQKLKIQLGIAKRMAGEVAAYELEVCVSVCLYVSLFLSLSVPLFASPPPPPH